MKEANKATSETRSLSCYNDDNCDNRDCQIFLAGKHNLDTAVLDALILNYSTPALPGKVCSATDIWDMIKGLDCKLWIITTTIPGAGGGDPTTNDDIEIDVAPPLVYQYSIALFRGIFHLFGPDEFQFFKIKHVSGAYDVAFKVLKGGALLYCGDLSGLP